MQFLMRGQRFGSKLTVVVVVSEHMVCGLVSVDLVWGVFIEFFKTPKAEILKKTGPGTGELKWKKIKKKGHPALSQPQTVKRKK
jgi:hypothetical protein